MDNNYKILIQISGKYSTQKHADALSSFILENFTDLIESKIIVVENLVNEKFDFNISINDREIFSKRNFWNKYPNYEKIISEIQEILNEKNMYADMKAAYDFNNELF